MAALVGHRGVLHHVPPARPRGHRRLPPPLHAPQLQGQAVGARAFAILGSMAIEGPIISWVADHRKHHAFSDKPGDPHSPHATTTAASLRGLFHAHVGWLFLHTERANRERYAPDLMKDPVIAWVDRTFVLWVVAGLAIPFGLGWLIGGTSTRVDRPAVGRRGADARAAPRDLLHQLAVPLLRPPALRRRRRVPQPRVAVALLDGRVVASQPPCLPDLGRARAASGTSSTSPT